MGVDERHRVRQEVEVVAIVPDLLLLLLGLLAVRSNHLPVAVVVHRVDDELRSPMRIDKTPAVAHVDHTVVVGAFHRSAEAIAGALHLALDDAARDSSLTAKTRDSTPTTRSNRSSREP